MSDFVVKVESVEVDNQWLDLYSMKIRSNVPEEFFNIEDAPIYIKHKIKETNLNFLNFSEDLMISSIINACQFLYDGGGSEEAQYKYISKGYVDDVIENCHRFINLPKCLQEIALKELNGDLFTYEVPENLDGPHFYDLKGFLNDAKIGTFVGLERDEENFLNYFLSMKLDKRLENEVLIEFIKKLPRGKDKEYKIIEDKNKDKIYIFRKKEDADFCNLDTSKIYEVDKRHFEIEFDKLKLDKTLKDGKNKGFKM